MAAMPVSRIGGMPNRPAMTITVMNVGEKTAHARQTNPMAAHTISAVMGACVRSSTSPSFAGRSRSKDMAKKARIAWTHWMKCTRGIQARKVTTMIRGMIRPPGITLVSMVMIGETGRV